MIQRLSFSWLPLRRKGNAAVSVKKMTKPLERNTPAPSAKWDALVLLVLIALLIYVDVFVPPYVRPVDLDDPAYKFPHIPDIVSAGAVVAINFFSPLAILLLTHLGAIRQIRPLFLVYTLSLFESNILTMLITTVFKVIVGRPRPYFASVCESYAPNVENLCVGHPDAVREARKSFPSGHSSLSFSAATFVFLYLTSRFRVNEIDASARLARMVACMFPLIFAGLIAVSRTIDYHHHYSDIIAGSAIGMFIAVFVFWSRFSSISKAMEQADVSRSDYAMVPEADEDSV